MEITIKLQVPVRLVNFFKSLSRGVKSNRMKRLAILSTAICAFSVYAGSLGTLNTFVAGNPITADGFNQNFSAIATRMAELDDVQPKSGSIVLEGDIADPVVYNQIEFKSQVANSDWKIRQIENTGPSALGLQFDFNASYYFNMRANGNFVTPFGSFTSSDVRLKKDIKNMSAGLKEINTLRPVNYYWKNSKQDPRLQYGLIAQEVKKILPEITRTQNDKIKTISVDYIELIPILIKAVQEQDAKIEALSGRVLALAKQNKQLKKLVLND